MKPIIFGATASDATVVHEQHLAGPDMNDEAAVNAWFCAWLENEDPIPDATAATFRGVGDRDWRVKMQNDTESFKDFMKRKCGTFERLK